VAVEFDQDLRRVVKEIYRHRRVKFLVMLLVVLLGIFALKFTTVQYYWYRPVLNVYSLTVTGYILSRFLLALFYRPPKDTGFRPTVSFVIPVKDDEDMIGRTIDRCFDVDYPKEKVELIVINDGSTDNTLAEIRQAQKRYPNLKVINFEQNRGKRHAMAAAFKIASNQILVCIDSDSLADKDSVRYIVQGFADPSVGAVCGHAYVLDADNSALAKMQEVRYYIAFKVMKAAEHVFSVVTCCSGCMAAYRRDYVMDVVEPWRDQRWINRPATFGDDRSLTNYMLRKYRVLYDSRAVVETAVPETWMRFFRQQLRWKKSWFRESLIAGTFMWYKHPIVAISFYLGVLLPLISPLIVLANFVFGPIFLGTLPVYYVMGFGLISLLYCFYYAVRRPNTKWPYGLLFCLVYMAVLAWQTYYAVLTSHKNHWGTR
jgi:hyaluronan synthase